MTTGKIPRIRNTKVIQVDFVNSSQLEDDILIISKDFMYILDEICYNYNNIATKNLQMKRGNMRYWLSYDLGLRGNYEGLYEWLDEMKAKECGDSIATFTSPKSREQIQKELSKILDKKDRVYIINMKEGGKFILGKRKVAAWVGYAESSIETEEEK